MVKDICWEVSETVIPDSPAWLNGALKSQVPGHPPEAGVPRGVCAGAGPWLLLPVLQAGPSRRGSCEVPSFRCQPGRGGPCLPAAEPSLWGRRPVLSPARLMAAGLLRRGQMQTPVRTQEDPGTLSAPSGAQDPPRRASQRRGPRHRGPQRAKAVPGGCRSGVRRAWRWGWGGGRGAEGSRLRPFQEVVHHASAGPALI